MQFLNALEERIEGLVYGNEPLLMEPTLEVMVQSAELRGIFDPLADTQYPFVEIYEDHSHLANTHGYCEGHAAHMDEIELSVKPVWNQRFRLRANGTRYYRFIVCLDHHVRMRTICGEAGFAAADAWAAAGNAGGPLALSIMIARRNEITGVLRLVINLVPSGAPRVPPGPDDYHIYEWNKPDLLKLGDRSALFDAREIGEEPRVRAPQQEEPPPPVKAPDQPVHRSVQPVHHSPPPAPPQQQTWIPPPAPPQYAATPPQTWQPPPPQHNWQPPPPTMPSMQHLPMTMPMSSPAPPMTMPTSSPPQHNWQPPAPLNYPAPAPMASTAFKSEPVMTAQHPAPMPTQYMSAPAPHMPYQAPMPIPSMLEANVPATQGPTAPVPRSEDVPVRLRIEGINLPRLSPEARRQLESSIVTSLAKTLGGVPTADVRDTLGRPASMTLRPGSVIAEGFIRGLDLGSVSSALKSRHSMRELATAALSVAGVHSATTGTVEATAEVFDPANPLPFERPQVSQRPRANTAVEVPEEWQPPQSRHMAPPSIAVQPTAESMVAVPAPPSFPVQSLPARPTAESMVAFPDMAAPAPLAWNSAPAVRAFADNPPQGAHTYVADNSQLRAETAGLGYRRSKDYNDKAISPTGHSECLEWNDVVQGVNEGDGWIRVAPDRFLPLLLSGKPVLRAR